MAGGTNNDCHRVETERGDFVFKVLGYDVNSVQLDQRMSEKLDLEFGVLDHLEERGFSYEVPGPLENEYGNRLSRVDGDYVIVAPFIEGTTPTELNRAKQTEMGRGLGRYHRLIEDYPADFYYDDHVFPWLRDRLDNLRERETAERVSR